MAYSVLDDLKKKIDESVLVQLTDTTDSGAIDTAKVDRAIRDADALINAHAGKVYSVPLNPVPYVVTDLSATLAIVNLHRFRSVDSPVWNAAYEKAVALLKQVADGAVTLDGVQPEPPAADSVSSTVTFTSADRRFSRDTLKGM